MPKAWWTDLFGAVARAAEAHGDSDAEHGFKPSAYQRIGQHLSAWVQHFSAATQNWLPNLIDMHECDFCEAEALTQCIACGSRVCLAHAHVSYRAEAICDECVQFAIDAKRTKKQKKKPRRAAPTSTAIPTNVVAAFRELGLSPSATPTEAKQAYRKAVQQYHPDRFARASARQQAAATLKMQRINEANQLLQAWFREAA